MIDWLRRKLGKTAEAEKEPVAEATPSSPPLPLDPESLARECLRGDQPAQALELLRDTTSLAGLTMSGEAAMLLGRREAARGFFERALALDPTSPGLRDRLEALRDDDDRTPAADAAATLAVPRLPAPFRVVGELGRGGSATLYLAVDDALARRVALKVYHRPETDRPQLEREARLAVLAAGEGVVPVYDASPDDGWIALALAEGSLAGADVPVEAWLPVISRALLRTHAQGFVHGDVKASNILRAGDTFWLSDFGTAARVGEAYQGGTPGYLSPSRARGEPAREADDVYALARTLEHLGRPDLAGELDRGAVDLAGLAARPSGEKSLAPEGSTK